MNKLIGSGIVVTAVTAAGLILLTLSCEKENSDNRGEDPGEPVIITTEIYQKAVIDSANSFALDIFRPVVSDAKGSENVMISPFSISSALSMTLNGAAGETYEAMKKTLSLEDKTLDEINSTYLKLMTEMVPVDERVVVEIANSVWVEKKLTVKQEFITALQTWYKAEAKEIDVKDPNAVKTVNDWIADKTHDKITDMLDGLDPDLAMLLINAVYFNGKWRYQFDKSETQDMPFYVTPSSPVTVPMMNQLENFKAIKDNNLTLVDIPYGQGNYSMLALLPDQGVTPSDVADGLTPAQWNDWMNQLGNSIQEVDLSMPRFKYEYKRLLNDDLIGLGMGVAFTDVADFSNISTTELLISRVIHQTFIETNEEGTEAAAATVVEIVTTSIGPEPVIWEINLNRPFICFIHENSTGTILFMGVVNNPAAK